MEALRPSPSMVLAAYAQTLIEGRKVIVFGDCTSPLPDQLLARGARLVHVYDTDLTRVAEAAARSSSRDVAYAPLGQSGVAVRDGAFDIGIIENLAAHADQPALMKRLRRSLAARGVAFVLCPNVEVSPILLSEANADGDAPSYYELYERVSAEFDEVRMVGQTPFVGYALADFTPSNDDEFSIDTGFIEGGAEEPEWYLAVASHFPVAVERFNVVQLPAASTISAGDEQLSAELGKSEARLAELEAQLEVARRNASSGETDKQLLLQAKQELDKRDAWVAELEGRAATADTRADDAEARADEAEARADEAEARADTTAAQLAQVSLALADAEQRAKQAAHRAAELEQRAKRAETSLLAANAELSAQQQDTSAAAERDALAAKLNAAEAELERLQHALSEREAQTNVVEVDLESAREEVEALETQLRERARHTQELREHLRRTEQLAWQLLGQVEADVDAEVGEPGETPAVSGANPDPALIAELRANLEELARVDARRVADLTAAQWTVAELENKLNDQAAESEAQLQSLRAELQQKITLLQQYQSAQTH